MTKSKPQQSKGNQSFDSRWKDLYKIGGIAAVVSEIVLILGIVAAFIWPYSPGNDSTESILLLLQTDKIGGLFSLDLHLLIGNLFGILLFLALYVSLKEVNESYALIALVLGLFADVLIIPARPIAELFNLSELYVAATTEAAKSQYLAAGEAILALFDGTGWIVNTFIGGFSLLMSSILMLRSHVFSKATAYVGIITNIAVCGFFIPGVGTFLLFLSIPGYMIWNFQLAVKFFEMSAGKASSG